MNVAIDISPIEGNNNQHKVRGVGFYIERLKEALETYCKKTVFTYFSTAQDILEEADVVHYPYFEPFFLSLPLLKKKTVVTVHDLTPLIFPKQFPTGIRGNLKWHIQKSRLKRMSAVITDSEASKRDIVRLTAVSSEKIHVVYLAAGNVFKHLALSQKEKETIRNTYNLPEQFGLYVGDVTWNKNLPRLVRAVKKADIPFVFVGKAIGEGKFDASNPWNADLIELQKEIKESSSIHSLGFVPTEDLVGIYNLATFFILPSLYEGFGLPVLEAMQCGTPVITTKEGSLKEVAGDAAYFVNAHDENDIAKGMQTVFTDKKVQESLRQAGFHQVNKFSWKKAAEETNEVYKKVVNNS